MTPESNKHLNPSKDSNHNDLNATRPELSDEISDDLDFWELDPAIEPTDDELEEINSTPVDEHSNSDQPDLVSKKQADQTNTEVKTKSKLSPIEIISILICVGFFIFLGVSFSRYLHDKFDVITEDDWVSNIPVKGQYAAIKSIDTWWGAPIYNAKVGIKLAPYAKITLDDETQSGAFLIAFYGDKEELNSKAKQAQGDSFLLEFKDGKFLNGENSITIHATDGLSSVAKFLAYRAQNDSRWEIKIKEAPTANSAVSEFADLGNAPIEPIRH